MQRQRIDRNVATLVDPPAQRMSEVATALTLEEANAVLHMAHSQRNAARWTVALALCPAAWLSFDRPRRSPTRS
jgi:integrase